MLSITKSKTIIGLLWVIIWSILTTLLTGIFSKNNEIETRLFEIKINSYEKIYDIVENTFNEKDMREDYLKIFKAFISNSWLNDNYLKCPMIKASECKNTDPVILKTMQSMATEYVMEKYTRSALGNLRKYRPIFPQQTFSEIKKQLESTLESGKKYEYKRCKEWFETSEDWCILGKFEIASVRESILEILEKDIQQHY